jgi:hypothetical protein
MYPSNDDNNWQGKLIGADDYASGNYDSSYTSILLIGKPGTSSDLFIMFNRAKRINEEVKEAANAVTIVEASNVRNQSWLLSKLSVSDNTEYRYSNFEEGGSDLVIKVCEEVFPLDEAGPDYAQVIAYMDNGSDVLVCEQDPTSAPSSSPTAPTAAPSESPMPEQPSQAPTTSPTSAPSSSPTEVSSNSPSAWPTATTTKPTESPTKAP